MIKGYRPQDFNFIAGKTPMSTLSVTAFTLVAYYITIFGGRELMRNRPAFELNGLFKIHNFYLVIISGALLALMVEQLIPELVRNGIFHGICSHDGGWTRQMVVLYYVSSRSKCQNSAANLNLLAQLPHKVSRTH